MTGQFLRFCAVGAANTLVHMVVAWFLVAAAGAPVIVANAIGFAAANLVSFAVNARVTFGVQRVWRLYPRFLGISLFSLLISTVVVAAAQSTGIHYLVAIAAAALASAFIGFTLSRVAVFGSSPGAPPIPAVNGTAELRPQRPSPVASWVRGALHGKFGIGATVLMVLAGAVAGYLLFGFNFRVISDEYHHALQIWHFFVGNYQVLAATTMLPTYHAIMALAERLPGYHSPGFLRLVNLIGSLPVPVLIWHLSAMHTPEASDRKTVQWFFMPLLFPFFFLIFTDAWSLGAVLAMMLWTLNGRYVLAASAGLFATVLRQDMIVWVAMAWLLVALENATLGAWRDDFRRTAAAALLRGWPLLAVLALFTAFYLWNGGVAVGDRARHEVGFNLTNIYFLLLCAWIVFLPLNLEAVPRIRPLLRRPVVLSLVIAAAFLYMATFANEHPYNGEQYRFWIRNEVLHWLSNVTWLRIAAFVPMAWMVLTVCVTRLAEPRLLVLFAIAPLSVGLHPLIEQRYYLPALTLFQVWRPSMGDRWENALLLLYAAVTPIVCLGIAYRWFFL